GGGDGAAAGAAARRAAAGHRPAEAGGAQERGDRWAVRLLPGDGGAAPGPDPQALGKKAAGVRGRGHGRRVILWRGRRRTRGEDMRPERSDRGDSLPLSADMRIDEVCARFEAAWLTGQAPRIEDFLGDVEAAERDALLRELLRVELDWRIWQ